jgi:AcrR family transcriptional regulator
MKDMASYDMNMFKEKRITKGDLTCERIFHVALNLFREKGFEGTTMREVAAAANMSLGAAYYYFASKEAIVLGYYEKVQEEHELRLARELPAAKDFRRRIGAVMHSKLEILKDDRALMSALFRFFGNPKHPLSIFAPETRIFRTSAIAVMEQAIGDEKMPPDLREIAPQLLWVLHLGFLFYFIYDESPGQQRSHQLIDGALDVVVNLLSVARLAVMKPFRGKLIKLMRDAALLIPREEARPMLSEEALSAL